MIIQQKKEALQLDTIHSRIFEASSLMLSASAGTSKPSNLPYFAKTFFSSLLNMIILITPYCRQVWNCVPIDRLYDISKYFGPMLINAIGLDYFVSTLYCLFGWTLISILSQIYAFVKPKDMKNYLSLLFYSTRLFRLLLAPILTLIAQGALQPIGVVLNICSVIVFILLCCHLVSFRIFSFNPIPRSNQFYELTGAIGCLEVIAIGIQTVLLSRTNNTLTYIVLLCLYTALEMYRNRQFISWTLAVTAGIPFQTSIIFCIFTSLAGLFNNTSETLLYIFCMTLPVFWSFKIIQLFNIPLDDLFLSDCSIASTLEICRYIRCLWELEDNFDHKSARECMIQFLSNHQNRCREPRCPISKQKLSGLVITDFDDNSGIKIILDNYALFLLELRSFSSPTLHCLYFIQLFLKNETDCITMLKDKKLLKNPTNFNFINFHLERLCSKDITVQTVAISNDNFNKRREQFVSLLKLTLSLYCRLFSQLRRRSLNLAAFQDIGDECYDKQANLRANFEKFLKNQRLCLQMIEFYLQFLNNIQGDSASLRSYVENILRIKMLHKYQDYQILECPNACLEIKDDMTIGDANMEACKLFGSSKLEIIDKPLSQFMVPAIEKDDLEDVMEELQKTPLICFLMTRQGQYEVCRLKSRKKTTNKDSKQFLEIYPQKLLSNVCFALADNHGVLIQSSAPKLIDKSQEDILIDDLFRDYISPSWALLLKQQQMNMDYESGNITIALSPTIEQTMYCVRIDMVPHLTLLKEAHCSLPPYFKFNYNIENDKIVAVGSQVEKSSLQVSEIRNRRISLLLGDQVNYASGIKPYRLQGDRIISKELERQADGSQFTKKEENQDMSRGCLQKLHSSNILRAATIIVSFLLLGAVLARVYLQSSRLTLINQTYSQYIHIQMFEIRYYWSTCIMRDADFGYLSSESNITWTSMITELVKEMQEVQKQRLYSSETYDVTFNDVDYRMSLDEIYNMIVAHMLEAVGDNSVSISETIHYLTMRGLRTYSQKQVKDVTRSIETNLEKVKEISWVFFIILTALTAVLLVILIMIEYAEIKTRAEMLVGYRMISDKEIQSYIIRFRQFETLLGLNQKNIEVEVYGCFEQSQQFKKRPRIKKVKAKLLERKKFLSFLLFVFCISTSIYFLGHQSVDAITTSMHTSFILNRAIGQSYSNYIFLSIDAQNIVDEATMNSTFISLSMIEQNKNTLPFSNQFNNYIKHVFFQDCCDAVKQLTPEINCQNFSDLNKIKNPFEFGLVAYLYHVYYQILEDIEQTVSSTGIQATAFTRLARHLISKTEEEWNLTIQQAQTDEKKFILLQVFVLLMLVGLMLILKRKNKDARHLIDRICSLVNLEREVVQPEQFDETELIEQNKKRIKFQELN